MQQLSRVQLHEVYSLALAMRLSKAVRGFFWAPTGFSDEAVAWVANKSIVLINKREMEHLIDSVARNGSRWLEH